MNFDAIVGVAEAALVWTWGLLNSNFSTALAGAAAGAYGAQFIAERNERQRRLLREIRSTNAAIIVAFSITNMFYALKRQYVKELKERFEKQKKDLDDLRQKQREEFFRTPRTFEFMQIF